MGKAKTLCSLKNTLEGDGEDREKGKRNIYIALRRGRQDGHQSGCNGPKYGRHTAGIIIFFFKRNPSWLGVDHSDKPVESEKPPTQLIQRG